MVDEQPRQIGRYKVDGVLGRGGAGTVYRGVDPTIGRTVAIKVLVAQGAESQQRFLIEVRAAGQLNHPNVAGCSMSAAPNPAKSMWSRNWSTAAIWAR